MILTADEALEIIKRPRNKALVQQAVMHEHRLTMHCEPIMDAAENMPAIRLFLQWVETLLPKDKFERFQQLFQLPVETVDNTEEIFQELKKIFDAPDQHFKSQFRVPEYETDFSQYLTNIRNDSFWQNDAYKALKTGINSYIVVDLPVQQTTFRPEPYYYILPVSAVYDVEINETNNTVEYICIHQNNGSLLFIEDSCYRIFVKPDSGEWQLKEGGEIRHGLSYTPVKPMFSEAIAGSRGINKRSPITSCLGRLDWLLFWKISQKYLKMYGSWPIIVKYNNSCEYADADGNVCKEGYINYMYLDPTSGTYNARQKVCPVCAKRSILGAGTLIDYDPPTDSTDADLLKQDPVRFIEPSNDKLEFGYQETERLEREIFVRTVGYFHEATKEAINEKQVASQYESRIAILDNIREQFEEIHTFTVDTLARLRYGSSYLNTTIYYGRQYFLQTADDIAVQYQTAKKAGLPQYEVARIREVYSQTRFKNNEQQYLRNLILSQLEPYPDFTVHELKGFGIAEIEPELFELKLNFPNYVARFERELLNIVEFGSLIDFKTKINNIQKKLLSYVTERTKARPQPNAEQP